VRRHPLRCNGNFVCSQLKGAVAYPEQGPHPGKSDPEQETDMNP
jgi:hypothetical protein